MIANYVQYNLWANTLMIDWLRTKPEPVLKQEMVSSFPSLEKTILHLWDAESIWYHRLHQQSVERPSDGFTGTAYEALDHLLASSILMRDFVMGLSEVDFTQKCTYTHMNGQTYSPSFAEVLHHCMNHGTFHRGQLVTMGRALGLTDPPKTDYIQFVREQVFQ
jgi:uncharacterized damage-inducible protein DinB